MRTDQDQPVRLADYQPPDWLVETVELDVSLHPTATRVRARLKVRPNPSARAAAPLMLDGDGLTLKSIKLDGRPLSADSFTATPDKLSIPQPPQRACLLEIETLVDPTANTQLTGLYRAGATYCTQCEAEGFRRITYFPDRPDVMAIYTTRIEAEKADAPVLLSNGNLVASGDVAGPPRHFAVWHDPFPKPSYLFALVGGALGHVEDAFVTMSGRNVALRIYVEPGKESRAGFAMDALKRAMRWDEQAFGREYDLDIFMIVAVSAFNMGAMENKGLNVFNDKYVLATPDTATDADYASIDAIIAHEYFHNWTGNRITCRDWFQLCLKEGLTVFRDQEYTADQRSRPVKRIADVRVLRAHQFVEDAGPLAHPVRPDTYREINNFYTPTVYEKGAEIVRMLKTLLGAQGFRKGMDLYFKRHDGRTCTLALAQMLRPTPGQSVKEPMVIPLAIGLIAPDGRDLPLTLADGRTVERGVLVLSDPAETFVFTNVGTRPVASLNRAFSAPVKLTANLTPDDLHFLAAHDSDPFNRWQALQTLASTLLTDNVKALRAGNPMRTDGGLVAALGTILADPQVEPAFAAQALAVPSEADIARELGRDVDPDAIFTARVALRAELGNALGAALRDAYRRLSDGGTYSPDAASAGRRSLKNIALDLLAASGSSAAIALAARQYQSADNMTDRLAAVSTLSLYPVRERQAAIDDFYRRYQSDPLVIDKWFALQAAIPEPATLERVQELTRHPAFSLGNPNRVRSLVGAFTQMNQTQFNRPDGAGYAFLADFVLDLDKRNPQTAARLLVSFRSWRALEQGRRAHAERALRHVATAASLSTDTRDIVTRTLA